MQIAYEKHTLSNGLDVIVHEDRDLPIVAVNVWYHVGSKNERPGLTGFAHLFEHLMFEGSAHHDHGYFPPLQEAGASLNGSTNADRTNYWEVVPVGALDRALWMESDRMGWLLPALTQAKLDNQREVVINERRQNYENRPYGLAPIAIAHALYPPDHSYYWPTIGDTADLRVATLDDVSAFFARYYHPANASLAIAGDVEAARAFDLAEQYFGAIPAGPAVDPVVPPPSALAGEIHVVLEDRVEYPRLYMAWHSPALFAEGDAACDLLADLLSNGKTSRLFRKLVHERRMALDVTAYQSSRELGGIFQIVSTAAAGITLDALRAEIDLVVRAVADEGPSAGEMTRGRAQAELAFVQRLQTVGGFSGKSDQLNAYNIFLDDPGAFGRDLARYRTASSASVQQAAARLLATPRVTLSMVPRGRRDLALPGAVEAVAS